VFAEEGFAGARVDAIADRARVNKRMIYAYFGDKDGIYRAVLASRLSVPPYLGDPAADPRTALTELVRWYFRLLAGDPTFTRLLAGGLLAGSSGRRAVLLSSAGPALERVAGIVRRGIDAGAFRRELSPEMLRAALVSTCLGYFLLNDTRRTAQGRRLGRWTDEEFLEELCRLVFDGVAVREVTA
jgi:TetR/AcrR family transcriptional regulator